MWRNTPLKAVANGEPTYERIGRSGENAAGWWQGHEAWLNLCAGGTMGLIYGAGSLWQWRLHADEPGHEDWAFAPGAGWREALHFEGAHYIGVIQRLLAPLPFLDMQPNWIWTHGCRGLAVPGKLFLVYAETGRSIKIISDQAPSTYRVHDARSGVELARGRWTPDDNATPAFPGTPIVLVCVEG
jgi:hypothetical protein